MKSATNTCDEINQRVFVKQRVIAKCYTIHRHQSLNASRPVGKRATRRAKISTEISVFVLDITENEGFFQCEFRAKR